MRHLTGGELSSPRQDRLAVEQALALHLVLEREGGDPEGFPLGLVLRTPGQDRELALGYAFSEGLITNVTQVRQIQACAVDPGRAGERLTLFLDPGALEATQVSQLRGRLERRRRLTPSVGGCGVCGSSELESLLEDLPPLPGSTLDPGLLERAASLPPSVAPAFAATGGTHSACLLAPDGRLLLCREDVGRHNALDKLIGALLLESEGPTLAEAAGGLVLVSGRVGWELVQKCLRAGLPALAARGAATSLAAELAGARGMLLAGFIRPDRAVLYCGADRLGQRR